MSNRDFQVTARHFKIPITMEEMDNIDHCERRYGVDRVDEMLEKLDGVFEVDFNGHFGSYIYLSIEKEFDNDKTLQLISDIINNEGNKDWYDPGR